MKNPPAYTPSTRIAILTNTVPVYRLPVLTALSAMPELTVRVFLSLPVHYADQTASKALDIRHSRGINLRRRTRHTQAGTENVEWLHIPLLLFFDLLRFRPDLIISGEFGLRSCCAYLVARLLRIPLVLWSEEIQEHAAGIGGLQRRLRSFLIARADGFLAWGKPAMQYLQSWGVDEPRLFYCAQAVDNEYWQSQSRALDREAIRHELGIHGRMFLAVGRLMPRKGFDRLIEAWLELPPQQRSENTLIVIGDGPQAADLRQRAQHMSDVDIRFPGGLNAEEIARYYAAADVFVFPSLLDVWGLVVNEAMAFGLPILASRHAGASQELVVEGVGELFDPIDHRTFCERLRDWCRKPLNYDRDFIRSVAGALNFGVSVRSIRRMIGQLTGMSEVNGSSLPPIIMATLLHERDHTGVCAHMNSFREYLHGQGQTSTVLTPFSAPRAVIYPLFGLRKLVGLVHREWSVWWYRYWHYAVLRRVLAAELARHAAAVVYVQCPLSAKAALEARASRRQRIVMIAHFNVSQAEEWCGKGAIRKGGQMYRAIEKTERDILPRLDGLVFVSDYMKTQITDRIQSLSRLPSAVIPNFVTAPANHANLNTMADLINIGTLEPRKHQRFLLDVLRHANQQDKRYTLTLVGDGPDRHQLETLISEYGLAGQVTLLGARTDAAALIARHRIYVHSAVIESFGIVLIEALAAGIPVLAGCVGGIPEVFTDGQEGRYWPLDDASAAASILISLLDQPATLEHYSRAARQRYLTCFSPDVAAERLWRFLLASTVPQGMTA